MNDTGVKQQIVDSIKNADTVLVTVGQNPSVDELTAALGLTLYLNEIGKHATAVVSGDIPPAITFLKPEKVFENSVDSLRDFVIALDKEKADHLRYKVDGDVVKIFITPYKTVITQKDLEYSQGDYNVEMVLALGVKSQDDLDKALSSHGRILHDAAVATVGSEPSTLGTMDWNNSDASSLSEMTAELAESLVDESHPMTEQVASAFLTGIVAATDRFSNDKTSSRAMTVAAQLMARGANQQLIAAKLREGSKLSLDEGKKSKQISSGEGSSKNNKKKSKKHGDNGLNINHDTKKDSDKEKSDDNKKSDDKKGKDGEDTDTSKSKTTQRLVETPEGDQPYDPAAALDAALKKSEEIREEDRATEDDELARQLEATVGAATPAAPTAEETAQALVEESAATGPQPEAQPPVETPQPETPQPQTPQPETPPEIGAIRETVEQGSGAGPHFGGTLNATTEQAAENKRLAGDEKRNKTILTRNPGSKHVSGQKPIFDAPFNGAGISSEPPSIDPFKNIQTAAAPDVAPAPAETSAPQSQPEPAAAPPAPTLTQLEQQHQAPAAPSAPEPSAHENALGDVQAALEAAPAPTVPQFDVPPPPAPEVAPGVPAPNTPPPPPTPDFTELPPMPQMPDFSQLPPAPGQDVNLPPEQPLGEMLPPAPPQPQPAAPADPGQFKIPGQQ